MSPSAAASPEALAALVVREARLLDEKRHEEWYALFTDDAVYWMPLVPGSTDVARDNALLHEDRLLLRLRIDRLAHARAFSQQPPSRSLHVLQAPTLEPHDPAQPGHRLRTPFLYVEAQGDTQLLLAAVAWHTLVRGDDGSLAIREKRVDLLNCDAALPSVQLFL